MTSSLIHTNTSLLYVGWYVCSVLLARMPQCYIIKNAISDPYFRDTNPKPSTVIFSPLSLTLITALNPHNASPKPRTHLQIGIALPTFSLSPTLGLLLNLSRITTPTTGLGKRLGGYEYVSPCGSASPLLCVLSLLSKQIT